MAREYQSTVQLQFYSTTIVTHYTSKRAQNIPIHPVGSVRKMRGSGNMMNFDIRSEHPARRLLLGKIADGIWLPQTLNTLKTIPNY